MNVLEAISEAGPKACPADRASTTTRRLLGVLVLREMGPAAKDAVPSLIEKLQIHMRKSRGKSSLR